MYEKFYEFNEKPFNTTPDSKFFYPSNKHAEALSNLEYAVSERKGFVVVTGEIGAGKTTVCRALLNKLEPNTKVAVITNTHLTSKELIAEILEEFDIEHTGGTKQKLLSHLNKYLIHQLSQDTNVVLIIDEAQNLTPNVLEEVRMLSNLETEKEKLVQIILIGQPQLKVKLQNPRLEQFKQRIALYYHIPALNKEETQEYILHRLKLASSNGVDIFTPQAVDLIFEQSRGIPRLINLICDSALLSGYIYDTRKITEQIIKDVVKERNFTVDTHDSRLTTHDQTHDTRLTTHDTKTYCCSTCYKYMTCETKYIRGTKGEEQLCCPNCQSFMYCTETVKKIKLN